MIERTPKPRGGAALLKWKRRQGLPATYESRQILAIEPKIKRHKKKLSKLQREYSRRQQREADASKSGAKATPVPQQNRYDTAPLCRLQEQARRAKQFLRLADRYGSATATLYLNGGRL